MQHGASGRFGSSDHQQAGLALLGQRHRSLQLRPVAALAAFDLDEFRDLLTVVAQEIAPHAQDQASRHRRCCCRFPAQLDRLQSDPHPQTGRGVVHIEGTKARSIAKTQPSPERTLAQFLGFSANC